MKEPLDGGCDKAMAQQGLLDRIKEEPDDAHVSIFFCLSKYQ